VGKVKRICIGLLAIMAAADTGTPTRPNPADYQAHQSIRYATIAASRLPPAQTAKIFSPAVSRNFIVVEIAIYPESGRTFELLALDFALKNSSDDRIYAVAPEEAAWHGRKPPSQPGPSGIPSSPVSVISDVEVGIGTRTNPATGRSEHGVATYGGVEVTNRPPAGMSPGGSSSADSTWVLEGKLRGLELQEGQTTRPVSGYLYFPMPKKQKNSPLVLEYSRSGERAFLTLPVN
jgi:hypothetical protein